VSFSGRLKALSISDVLEFLRVLNRRGVLELAGGGRVVRIQVRDAEIQAVTVDGEAGSLAHFLYHEGGITRDQMEAARERERNGDRLTRVLIEAGVLSPRGVWEALRRQARALVGEIFAWEQGEFRFQEGAEITPAGMEVHLPILEVICEGIRNLRDPRLFEARMPSDRSRFEALPEEERKVAVPLEPHERYVLSLVDSQRTLAEVAAQSEIGRAETLRVMFLLFSVGFLKVRAAGAPPEAEPIHDETGELLHRYNEMFAFLHRYLVREVGPIGEAVLDRYYQEQRSQRPALFSETSLGRDGMLDEAALLGHVRALPADRRREQVVDGLNELLYAELLAVRRTLGAQHEGRAVQGLRDLGLQPVTQVEADASGPSRE
jgi:hypothetical protein